jgi:hypothetical protein
MRPLPFAGTTDQGSKEKKGFGVGTEEKKSNEAVVWSYLVLTVSVFETNLCVGAEETDDEESEREPHGQALEEKKIGVARAQTDPKVQEGRARSDGNGKPQDDPR